MTDKPTAPSMASTLKSLDTEECIDIWFYRPIGYRWALLFRRLGVSPNAVTIMGIFIGIAAGVCFYYPNLRVNMVGMLLLIWANSFDSADGQLARMTGQKSPLGRVLDGFCGDVWFFTIYVAICLRLMPEWGLWIWVLAIVTGSYHSKQAAMADYYRNIHLLFLKGRAGSELSHSQAVEASYRRMTWRGDFVYKLFEMFYLRYTRSQERSTPRFQEMMAVIRRDYADEAPEWFRTAFRARSLPLMKYTNMLSFNTRVIALFVSLLIDVPWLYFAFELTVLNAMLIYMMRTHEHFCAQFTMQLKEAAR
ncbi:CDP-alcohol phosphatidyltransferase [Tannerella sp. oral taxon 808]|nr:CDP-alcohol phosphatidyltransferase [Tannerella sp. oral taxon 808]